ncbi:receptor for retinol uptake stra6-like isoform X2 [Biomphalaria glabrata]|uniref:Receptor for retinol uptake stra6-like isoform X2 n=1 Tax=Biomphalaria glabrata TaxID=6526 RepID=A0A9W2Z284_BIOGL|nr:receptor for retinol uptake stra6-like isoform X2 [Biomphalaria glabrata]
MMALTKQRTQTWTSFFKGRPALIYPMDTLTRLSRLSYCAAFGATAFLVYQITLQRQLAINYEGPISLTSLIALLSMLIYGMVFFPIFACLALRTAFGYALGSLYIWVFFIIDVMSLIYCASETQEIMRFLPSVLCRAFLCISLPVKFVWAFKKGNYFVNVNTGNSLERTLEQVRDSYQGRHVRNLLRKTERKAEPVSIVSKINACFFEQFWRLFYHRQKGFRFPTRFVSVLFVGGCVVYILTVEFLFVALAFMKGSQVQLAHIHYELINNWTNEPALYAVIEILIYVTLVLHDVINLVYYSLIVALALSCTMTLVNILHMSTSFRKNLYMLYRGDYSYIPMASTFSAKDLCVGSIKYAGFQVAYLIWGFMIITVLLFFICFVTGVFILFIIYDNIDWLLNKVLQIWPGILVAIALIIVQKVLARFVFLQGDGQHLRLDNRRFYFITAYFMFFYNIFLGIASCLLRIVQSIAVGILFLARLDTSPMPRKFEGFDPGFSAYTGYIHMEMAHTHPVVLVFIQLLYTLSRERKSPGSMTMSKTECGSEVKSGVSDINHVVIPMKKVVRNRSAQFNWLVIYTLLQNPSVRMYRKGFIQSMRKAVKEGLKIPISDQPITDFDLVKLQEEKERGDHGSSHQTNSSDFCISNLRMASLQNVL